MNHTLTRYICIFFLLALVTTPAVFSSVPTEFFMEDFNGDSLSGVWSKHGGGTAAVSGGILTLSVFSTYAHTTYQYDHYFSGDFRMEMSVKAQAYAELLVGVCDVSTSTSMYDIPHYIFFKRPPNPYYGYVYLMYSDGGADVELASVSASSANDYVNLTLVKKGTLYQAYVNGANIYSNHLNIAFDGGYYTFSFDNVKTYSTDGNAYIDYIYTSPSLYITANTTINGFEAVPIDSISINIISQILKIFIDACKTAMVVGQVIYENIIDITTTVIKIGQSTLTIIAQSATYIYSGLITIIDKVVVAINSFNALIDSIITTFETLYDEDTVYGSIIRVIPLILLLSIPTIVVYYKIGDFATIPMFMFMSIVAYMTSLMPLWILVVALIGCITILIQKQRRSN